MKCKACGIELERKRYRKRLEGNGVFRKRKYCNLACMGTGYMKERPTKSAIGKRNLQHRKKSCEICGISENLAVHHKDRNRYNNELTNLQTLCGSCHTSLHHKQGDLVVKKPPVPCRICDKQSYRLGLCSTHLSRFKRHGNPLVVRGKLVLY